MLHPHHGQAEAVARITWLIGERAIGVVTGEVGAGKTVAARAATSAMDPVRHTIIYLANPLVGQRGIYAEIARTLGQTPRYLKAALVAQAAELLSAEHAEKAKTSVLIIDEAHLLTGEQFEEIRMLTNHDMDAHSPSGGGSRSAHWPPSTSAWPCGSTSTAWTFRRPSPTSAPPPARRPQRPAVQRRRPQPGPPDQPRHPQSRQQPGGPGPDRRLRRRQRHGRRARRPRRHRRSHRRGALLSASTALAVTSLTTGAAVSPPATAAHPHDQTRHDRPPDQDQLSDSQHHHDQ